MQVLANTDIEKVLENFGKRTRQEDPIVHFYETFLAAYDPETRERRGVYYTPEPVVQYIVKSVDYILKTRFGLEGGLAHTSDVVEYDREEVFLDEKGRPDRSKLLKTVQEEKPKVLILDPACGTGTFLYAVMDFIRAEFMKRGDAGLWSAYVRDHLLPRLFGFELLMAPYAVAHFKLGMLLAGYDLPKEKQKQWQYDFESDERLGIYLTNTLDEAPSEWQKLFGAYRILSEEANVASKVKRDLPIMVVMGNPPYSNFGMMNKGQFISGLLSDYKGGLKEKKINLDDDFIKFIRWAQWRIERTGYGVLAFITNNTYLDGITHRKMRHSLKESFDEIYILNLHGSIMKKEKCPDGSKDENVFDIQQGVSIGIFVRSSRVPCSTKVQYADLWGLRENKYNYLSEKDVVSTEWRELNPSPEYFFFVPKSNNKEEYGSFYNIKDIFGIHSSGIQTKRDKIAINQNKDDLLSVITDFARMSAEDIRLKFDLPKDGRDWKIKWASEHATEILKRDNCFSQILYRPFDVRWTVIDNSVKGLVAYPRFDVMQHMKNENLGLVLTRQLSLPSFQHVLATRYPIDGNTISLQTREYNYLFPLYLNRSAGNEIFHQKKLEVMSFQVNYTGNRIPNLNPDFISRLASRLGLKFVSDGHGDLVTTFGPEDIFDYIYAVFHSPTYRKRYAESLKIDFPRVPLTSNHGLFRKLCALGRELVGLHLLESSEVARLITSYPETGDNFVEKGFPKFAVYEEGKPVYVFINKTQYFKGVPKEVWDFHVGGYQVCEKWLKDRRGRKLSFDDLMHYQKVVVALKETIRLMKEIDKAIPDWPMK